MNIHENNVYSKDNISSEIRIDIAQTWKKETDEYLFHEFYKDVQDLLEDTNSDYTLICEDFNLILNPDLNFYNYKYINNPRTR